ncbi:glycine/D-amino acid oxidase-like deaminating enzyme [Paraburkholderia sp. BL18I3N2]|uniref:NAD(P)/FAD-dependent oxidoreductase n=1 Tax=Paraburkholderia sp. BL18I3N2 TaxID=1938799 RepID=UPI000D076603|nr:FAD-dependent oxidoreductase [Paraburkholderia sp. BL18I3N2]PRX21638.1 glycine/D-amino acid oxidase-like deaminating enzyme [Paraburkholderia sp. BL18I3N2]
MSERIVITGGGAIGCSIAYFLSVQKTPRREIWVIEKDPTYRIASSSLSASSIRQQFSTPICIQLSQFGYDFFSACERHKAQYGAGVDLVDCGYLFVGNAQQESVLRRRSALARSLGVELREYSAAALQQRYPWMNVGDLTYAVEGLAGEGWFDGYSVMQWFRNRAREAGVHFTTGEAAGYRTRADRITHVELTDGREISGDTFVNASGAWCASVAKSVGVDLPVRPRRRSAFVVSCPTAIPDMPILIDSSGIYLRREQNHFLCIISPSVEMDLDNLPLDVQFSEFDEIIWPTLAERIPAFEALRVEHAWAGYYEYNILDQNGIVGQSGPENSFVAAGFSGHGMMHSPGVGRAMAELLTFGEFRTLDLSPLSPARLTSGQLVIEEGVY